MIFYLAILLILCGLLIIISALFIETNETKNIEENTHFKIKTADDYGAIKADNYTNLESNNKPLWDFEIASPDELDNKDSIFSELEDTFDIESRFHDDTEIIYNHERDTSSMRRGLESDIETEIADDAESNSLQQEDNTVYAVMYDDKSDLIDYSSGVGTIDSTFLKYNNIKRIGRGIIESDSDGINFYLDEKLYRFDSHRINDIWRGENYVALPLKGSGVVKLFIIENSPNFQIMHNS